MSSTILSSSGKNESDDSFDIDKTIDSYIESSSLSNKMRDENPNLQPMNESQYTAADFPDEQRQKQKQEYERTRIMLESTPSSSGSELSSTSSSNILGRFKTLSLRNEGEKPGRLNSKRDAFKLERKSSTRYEAPPSLALGSAPTSSSVSESMDITSSDSNLDEDYENDEDGPSYDNESSGFWKYHILKFGKDLYLTTNPAMKYLYCRPGPGIYVQIEHDTNYHALPRERGFRLKITDIESIHLKLPPRMIITKKSGQNPIIEVWTLPDKAREGESGHRKVPESKSLAIPRRIDNKFFPYDKLGADRHVHLTNYEIMDLKDVPWNIGRIPRLKVRSRNKIKNIGKGVVEDNQISYKLIGKKNIYFHQNYIADELESSTSYRTRPTSSFIYDKSPFPPVLAHFRPFESKISKRFKHSMTRNINRFSSHPGTEQDKIRSGSIKNDIGAGSKINKYFTGSDGLYYLESLSDDAPNSDKLGWITIYEDESLFHRIPCPMFDLVLGLTLAVGIQESSSVS